MYVLRSADISNDDRHATENDHHDREVYDALYRVVGKGNISKFLENLARPHVMKEDLTSAYQAMATDTEREREALAWCDGVMD